MKILIFVAMMAVCSVSRAEWDLLIEDSERKTVWHVDRSSIQKTTSVVEIQFMVSYLSGKRTKEGKLYRSVKIYEKFDCSSEKASLSSAVTFTGLYGNGDEVTRNRYDDQGELWDFIASNSFEEELFKIACGKLNHTISKKGKER